MTTIKTNYAPHYCQRYLDPSYPFEIVDTLWNRGQIVYHLYLIANATIYLRKEMKKILSSSQNGHLDVFK